jgi:hypothetical protein
LNATTAGALATGAERRRLSHKALTACGARACFATQSPPGSKSSKSSKSSSKDKRRGSKDKSRRASRSANDVEDPNDSEQTPMLADAGESGSGPGSAFDTRTLAEQVDDNVHSSMAKVKVISLRE